MKTVTKWLLVSLMALLPAAMVSAVELTLTFPQNRKVFQTNERIDVSVVRAGEGELPAGNLTLVLTGEKTTMTFVFGLKAGQGSATDHLHLSGWLIKPGAYTLTATMGDATDTADVDVFSHIRKSSYRLIHWNGPSGEKLKGEGEDGMGFNLIFGGTDEMTLREKMDIMGCCNMGGGHQHYLNLDCDWSDPNVIIGAIQRGLDRSYHFRTMPNAIGVHLHDEPGLTWNEHPRLKDKDGKPVLSAHDIAAQRAAYFRAFDREQPWFDEVDTKTPEGLAAWTQLSDFKLRYMDALWKTTRDAVERTKPGALAVTQSQYGWTALYDGYYFNVARSMAVISGHGGYNGWGLLNLNPSFFLEFSLPRQLDKPTWYLPEWYDNWPEVYKLEHYLSFVTGIQGLAAPPHLIITSEGAPGVIEVNKVLARLGTIFTKPAHTRHDLAVLYSKSDSYFRKEVRQTEYLDMIYLASKVIQQPMTVVLEEDVLDGTLAAEHKAVVVVGVEHLDPAVVAALTDFAQNGGVVLVSDEVKVNIPGATRLGCTLTTFYKDRYAEYQAKTKDLPRDEKGNKTRDELLAEMTGLAVWMEAVKPVAAALRKSLDAAKIAPAFGSDSPLVAPGRQVRGEIEYIFAVNLATEQTMEKTTGKPIAASATITLADDGRPVYDAMTGGEFKGFAKGNGGIHANIDFPAGDMKAFARPARPIGGVLVFAPVLSVDLTRERQAPITLTFSAALVDTKNQPISGTAPLQIVVKDPAGKVRYDLFRATDAGVCAVELPLAANDPAGKWTVEVTDLLANTKGQTSFEFTPLTRARAVAGATHRAVFFEPDKANIFRFFRDHRSVTIAIGDSDYNLAAAERLVKILAPYNVTCEIVKAKDVPPREIREDELRTWCGTLASGIRAGGLKVGLDNRPQIVGWDLKNPTIVLGTPEDNVMLKHMTAVEGRNVLPYRPSATFPGRGNGMLAWNIQTLGHDVHAVLGIAYDAEGMSQAVGTLFEIMAGLDPLLPLALPSSATIEAAK